MVVHGLNKIKGFRCHRPSGAFYVFPNITGTGKTSKEMENYLMEEAGGRPGGTSFGRRAKASFACRTRTRRPT
jgi:aspartate/methionine/tyrosine aminotransferase